MELGLLDGFQEDCRRCLDTEKKIIMLIIDRIILLVYPFANLAEVYGMLEQYLESYQC